MKKTTQLPDYHYLHECFEYSHKTGLLTWKARPLHHFAHPERANNINSRQAGKQVKVIDHYGYVIVRLNQTNYRVHRIIWKMMTGNEPDNLIDHINGDRSDNRFGNLRPATYSQNNQNGKFRSSNTTGYKGVTYDKSRNKYQSSIWLNKQHISLGRFETPEAAHQAYCEASAKYHQEYGRVA